MFLDKFLLSRQTSLLAELITASNWIYLMSVFFKDIAHC